MYTWHRLYEGCLHIMRDSAFTNWFLFLPFRKPNIKCFFLFFHFPTRRSFYSAIVWFTIIYRNYCIVNCIVLYFIALHCRSNLFLLFHSFKCFSLFVCLLSYFVSLWLLFLSFVLTFQDCFRFAYRSLSLLPNAAIILINYSNS